MNEQLPAEAAREMAPRSVPDDAATPPPRDPAKKSIGSVSDLRGKRVGVETGTISHFTLLKALQKGSLKT